MQELPTPVFCFRFIKSVHQNCSTVKKTLLLKKKRNLTTNRYNVPSKLIFLVTQPGK